MIYLSVLHLFKYSNANLFFIIVAVLLVVDLLCFFAIKFLHKKNKSFKLPALLHIIASIIIYLLIAWALLIQHWETNAFTFDKVYYLSGFIFSVYVSKLVFLLLAFVLICIKSLVLKIKAAIILYAVAFICFTILCYGSIIGRFNFEVTRNKLFISDLPHAFNGFKLVQLSDLHLGVFPGHEHEMARIIDSVNSLKPDMLVITGDIINSFAQEITPFVELLAKIEAPYGKFAVTGNHDYGDYYRWNSQIERKANHQLLLNEISRAGFCWLQNANKTIIKNGDSIIIAGIENWGMPPYRQEGKIHKALSSPSPALVTIFLSHDPVNWDSITQTYPFVKLTLSGHTHGMQIGMRIFGIEFSPLAIGKKYWKGLYISGNQKLYINKGIGGGLYPGRVGIRPEISYFELYSALNN